MATVVLTLIVDASARPDASNPSRSPFRIVTTTSDLASLTKELTADLAEVTSLVPPTQNGEAYEPRPRDLETVRGASLVIRVGLDYDLWFDRLVAEAGSADLQRGRAGHVDTSRGIAVLELRSQSLGPAVGHAHGAGNPHYWLDPANAEAVTGSILEGLARVDPMHIGEYRSRRIAFLTRLARETEGWKRDLASLQGARVVAYHSTWPYFARRFRLNIVALIEPREGIPPSPAHLAELIRSMRAERVALILMEPYAPQQAAALLAERTGAKIAVLAPSVDALTRTASYFDLFRTNVKALLEAQRP